jgi:hypothetical protein
MSKNTAKDTQDKSDKKTINKTKNLAFSSILCPFIFISL